MPESQHNAEATNAYAALLAEDVRWGDTCNNRADVLRRPRCQACCRNETTLTATRGRGLTL
jgi:hypothetical protein